MSDQQFFFIARMRAGGWGLWSSYHPNLLTSVSIAGVTASSTTPTTDVGSVFPVGYSVPEEISGKLLQSGMLLGAVWFSKRNNFYFSLHLKMTHNPPFQILFSSKLNEDFFFKLVINPEQFLRYSPNPSFTRACALVAVRPPP